MKLIEKITDILIQKEIGKDEDKDIINFGLTMGVEIILNIITTIVVGLLLGLTYESFVFLISFSFIRTYAGGYHCHDKIQCYCVSSGIVILVLTIVRLLSQEDMFLVSVILLLISLPILLKFVPSAAKNKPLDEEEQKYYGKKAKVHLLMECVFICALVLAKKYQFALVICLSIMVSAMLVVYRNFFDVG